MRRLTVTRPRERQHCARNVNRGKRALEFVRRGFRWLGEDLVLHLAPPAAGLLVGAFFTVDVGLPQRLAIGALAGEVLGTVARGAAEWRTRDLRHRAVLAAADAAIALRATAVFTAPIPADLFGVSQQQRLEEVIETLRAGGYDFAWMQGQDRWASAWSDLLGARRNFESEVGPYAALLDSGGRRRVQFILADIQDAVGACAALDDIWRQLGSYVQWSVTDDSRYTELVDERAAAERRLRNALESSVHRCGEFERAALPYREIPDAEAQARRERERRKLALRVLRDRARMLLTDGAPYRLLEASTLAGVEGVTLRMIARGRAFDFVGDRAREGWGHFGAALSSAGQRFDHLTYHQAERVDDRARQLRETITNGMRRAGNAADAIASYLDGIWRAQRGPSVDARLVANQEEHVAEERTRLFDALDAVVQAVDDVELLQVPPE